MSAGTIAVLVGIVWPAVALVVAWRIGGRLETEGERYPVAESGVVVAPGRQCAVCAECSPDLTDDVSSSNRSAHA